MLDDHGRQMMFVGSESTTPEPPEPPPNIDDWEQQLAALPVSDDDGNSSGQESGTPPPAPPLPDLDEWVQEQQWAWADIPIVFDDDGNSSDEDWV